MRPWCNYEVRDQSSFALRLLASLMEEARRVAQVEGVAVNQLINVAVAQPAKRRPTSLSLPAYGARSVAPKPAASQIREVMDCWILSELRNSESAIWPIE
jgi:hypothetical protein